MAHLYGSLIVKKLGDVFGRRVDGIEGSLVIQELMVDISDEIPQDSFEVDEIKEQAYRIELFALDIDAHAVVVAVRILALAFVSA